MFVLDAERSAGEGLAEDMEETVARLKRRTPRVLYQEPALYHTIPWTCSSIAMYIRRRRESCCMLSSLGCWSMEVESADDGS
jgi:hypothetical protein